MTFAALKAELRISCIGEARQVCLRAVVNTVDESEDVAQSLKVFEGLRAGCQEAAYPFPLIRLLSLKIKSSGTLVYPWSSWT
jgi:hypothetical protein